MSLMLVGAMNFRDLGGFHTVDGRLTRFGRVFRSNALQELTPDDLEVLRAQLRLATVIDLRAPQEIARDGRGPLEREPLRYVHLPLRGDANLPMRGVKLADRYLSYLEVGGASIVKALETIADEHSQPLVFHCSAGKDRTGVLAALLLGCLGVDPETVVSDYAANEHERERLVEFLRRRPSYIELLDKLSPSALGSEPATMREFLHLLEERHGGPRDWALAAGVSQATLIQLEATLLEPGED